MISSGKNRAPTAADSGASRRGSHRLDDWRCRRLFAYRHLLKLRPVEENVYRAKGSLVHLGVMHYWLGRMGDSAARDPIDAMKDAPRRIAYAFPQVKSAMEFYCAYHDRATPDGAVIEVEREHELWVDGSTLHTQRFDRIEIRGSAGDGFVIVDPKTRTRPLGVKESTRKSDLATIASEYETTTQFVSMRAFGESVLAERLGKRFLGVEVELVLLSAPHDVIRVPVNPPASYVEAFPDDVVTINQEIDAEAALGKSPWAYRKSLSQCMTRTGRCEHEALCLRGKGALAEFESVVDEVTKMER